MEPTRPLPGTGSEEEKRRLRRVIARRQLVGASNDTAWGVLLDAMRLREQWTPRYRCKCVDADASEWDAEWWHHMPFSMLSIEWLDIQLVQSLHRGQLIPKQRIDHREWVLSVLDLAKLTYEVHGDLVRVFGYLPKSLDGLEP